MAKPLEHWRTWLAATQQRAFRSRSIRNIVECLEDRCGATGISGLESTALIGVGCAALAVAVAAHRTATIDIAISTGADETPLPGQPIQIPIAQNEPQRPDRPLADDVDLPSTLSLADQALDEIFLDPEFCAGLAASAPTAAGLPQEALANAGMDLANGLGASSLATDGLFQGQAGANQENGSAQAPTGFQPSSQESGAKGGSAAPAAPPHVNPGPPAPAHGARPDPTPAAIVRLTERLETVTAEHGFVPPATAPAATIFSAAIRVVDTASFRSEAPKGETTINVMAVSGNLDVHQTPAHPAGQQPPVVSAGIVSHSNGQGKSIGPPAHSNGVGKAHHGANGSATTPVATNGNGAAAPVGPSANGSGTAVTASAGSNGTAAASSNGLGNGLHSSAGALASAFRISRAQANGAQLDVHYTLTAFGANGVTASQNGVTAIPAGTTSANVPLNLAKSGSANGHEVFTLALVDQPGYQVGVRTVTLIPGAAGNSCSDAALLQAYRHTQSTEAFAALVERYRTSVFRTCYRLLGSSVDAEDVTQIVFLVLAQRQFKLNSTTLAGWLRTVARNAAITLLRSRRRRAYHEREAAQDRDSSDEAGQDLREELEAALTQMPPALREAVRLRYLEGWSQKDAARIAGCPRGTLAQRAARGIRKLRSLLRGKPID